MVIFIRSEFKMRMLHVLDRDRPMLLLDQLFVKNACVFIHSSLNSNVDLCEEIVFDLNI